MNPALTFLEQNWQRLSLERFGEPQLSSVMLTPRFRASSNVVLLVFAGQAPDPALVIKMARLADDGSNLRREASNLDKLHLAREGGFDSVPRVIALEKHDGHSFLIETMLNGALVNPAFIRQRTDACTKWATDWLTDFNLATTSPSAQDRGWFDRLVAAPIDHLRNALPLSREEDRLLSVSWELAAPLAAFDLPLVFEHGDLGDPNLLLLKDGSVGVVDWELAQPNSLPSLDLFFFLNYVAVARRGPNSPAEHLDAFKDAFFGPSAWAKPYLLQYTGTLDISQDCLTPLFILCWLRYLAKMTDRLCMGQSKVLPHQAETVTWLRENRYFRLWRYAVEHAADLCWMN